MFWDMLEYDHEICFAWKISQRDYTFERFFWKIWILTKPNEKWKFNDFEKRQHNKIEPKIKSNISVHLTIFCNHSLNLNLYLLSNSFPSFFGSMRPRMLSGTLKLEKCSVMFMSPWWIPQFRKLFILTPSIHLGTRHLSNFSAIFLEFSEICANVTSRGGSTPPILSRCTCTITNPAFLRCLRTSILIFVRKESNAKPIPGEWNSTTTCWNFFNTLTGVWSNVSHSEPSMSIFAINFLSLLSRSLFFFKWFSKLAEFLENLIRWYSKSGDIIFYIIWFIEMIYII